MHWVDIAIMIMQQMFRVNGLPNLHRTKLLKKKKKRRYIQALPCRVGGWKTIKTLIFFNMEDATVPATYICIVHVGLM